MPLYRSVSAQKGVSGGGTTGKTAVDRSAAQAALENAIKSGAFELMSSAKQQQLLMTAGMRFEDGVLKRWFFRPRRLRRLKKWRRPAKLG
jgi:hypothetical protein